MTLNDFYANVHGDYASVISRMRTEDRILKFLKMIPGDPSYSTLVDAMEKQNAQEAFRAAHTLKGLCLNFGLTQLQKSSSDLTENLRDGTFKDDTAELFKKVQDDYNLLIENLNVLALE